MLPGAEEYLSAFWELSSDRQIGMQAGPIPFTAIDRWATRNGVDDPDEFALLLSCIRAMDGEWLGQGEKKPAPQTKVSQRPMSADLFDALF